MKSISGKTAIVTGAASGIGQQLAYQLALRGAQLIICDVNETGLEDTTAQIKQLGQPVESHLLDVSNREAMELFAQEVIRKHEAIDILINNAGVALGRINVETVSYEQLEWIFGINFWGVVYGTKAFLSHLKSRPEASIVNISSLFGLIGVGYQASYVATKFAVRGFSESLMQEMEIEAPQVKITSVHPGGVRTNIARNARGVEEHLREKMARGFEEMAKKMPEEAALKIIKEGILKEKKRVLIGRDASFMDRIVRFFPSTYHKTVLHWLSQNQEDNPTPTKDKHTVF